MKWRIVLGLFLLAMLVMPAASIGYSPWSKPVESVDPNIASLISVFRQTTPAPARPEFINKIYEARKDGKTLDGGNPDLARPAYPDAEKKQAPVWLVPGANGRLYAWSESGKSASGTGGPVDDEFFRNYGWVSFAGSRGNSRSYSRVTVVVPDSITTVRLVFQRRNGKRFARDFTPHDNVVVHNDRRFRAAIINGRRFNFPRMPKIIVDRRRR